MNLFKKLGWWLAKTTSLMPAGRYEVEYSLPAASHAGVFGTELDLTRKQASRFQRATKAKTCFYSGYDAPWASDIADELRDELLRQKPGYAYPVGVIFALLPVETNAQLA